MEYILLYIHYVYKTLRAHSARQLEFESKKSHNLSKERAQVIKLQIDILSVPAL